MLKRFLYRASIFIPILFVYYISLHPVEIYNSEFGLKLSDTFLAAYLFMCTMMWIETSPFRESCKGTFCEILFNCIPIMAFLLVVFAQYHPIIAIVIIVIAITANIILKCICSRENIAVYFSECVDLTVLTDRAAVISVSIALLIPCMISLFVYKLHDPNYQARQEIFESLFSSEESEVIEINLQTNSYDMEFIEYFEEYKWTDSSYEERVDALQNLIDYEADKLGMPSLQLKIESLEENTYGMYTDSTITIDNHHLRYDSVSQVIESTLHEVYHGYEDYIVQNIDWTSELSDTAYFNTARQWMENSTAYISAEQDYLAYLNQPLESSANDFSTSECRYILSCLAE